MLNNGYHSHCYRYLHSKTSLPLTCESLQLPSRFSGNELRHHSLWPSIALYASCTLCRSLGPKRMCAVSIPSNTIYRPALMGDAIITTQNHVHQSYFISNRIDVYNLTERRLLHLATQWCLKYYCATYIAIPTTASCVKFKVRGFDLLCLFLIHIPNFS